MPSPGGSTGHRDPAEGPPSEQARAALADRLRREVADARVRFEEAGLRAETHRLLGQDAAAAEVVREQEQILAEVQDRLGRAVSAAVVERDAEQVLADLVASDRSLAPAAPVDTAPDRDDHPPRRAPARVPALSGVTSVVALLGVAALALLGVARVDQVEINEVAADSTPVVDLGSDDATTAPPSPDAVFSSRPGGSASDPATLSASTTAEPADATEAPLAGPTPEDDTSSAPTDEPTPAPELETVVQQLVDAVAGLGDEGDDPTEGDGPSEDSTDLGDDVGASVPGLEELVNQLGGDDVRPGSDGDGFVPGTSAQ